MSNQLNFALLGFGKMGQGFYKALLATRKSIHDKTGFDLKPAKILVRNKNFKRPADVDASLFTSDPNDILRDKKIRVVVDAIGGIEPTFSIVRGFIEKKKHIISANRALLAAKIHQLSDLANEHQIHFLTEPSLGGGIPVSAILQRDLVANRITEMTGIVSGVSNFILDQMTDSNRSLHQVLEMPEILRMAESIAVVDYEGSDSAMKVAILAATAFGIDIGFLDVYAEGIADITQYDIKCAKQYGYEIKPLAILRDHKDKFEIRVHPTLVPQNHPLVSVRGEYNAYYIKTDLLGEYMVYGLGVGTKPTSSLIMRDLVEVGNRIFKSPRRDFFTFNWNSKPVVDIDDVVTSYYLRFPCVDKPGVMGKLTNIIGSHNINIVSAHAEVDKSNGNELGYVHIFVENAQEKEVRDALKEVDRERITRTGIKLLRILD